MLHKLTLWYGQWNDLCWMIISVCATSFSYGLFFLLILITCMWVVVFFFTCVMPFLSLLCCLFLLFYMMANECNRNTLTVFFIFIWFFSLLFFMLCIILCFKWCSLVLFRKQQYAYYHKIVYKCFPYVAVYFFLFIRYICSFFLVYFFVVVVLLLHLRTLNIMNLVLFTACFHVSLLLSRLPFRAK